MICLAVRASEGLLQMVAPATNIEMYLVLQFGCSQINPDMVSRVERLTGKPAHPFLKRGVFFAHRDMNEILDCYEKGIPFYLYTGRVRSAPTFLVYMLMWKRLAHQTHTFDFYIHGFVSPAQLQV